MSDWGYLSLLPKRIEYFAQKSLKCFLDHHRYLAGQELDTDLPTEWEGRFFNNTPLKFLWLILNPAFYAFRPMIVRPKKPTAYELQNVMFQIVFNLWILNSFGLKGIGYLLIGSGLGKTLIVLVP